MRVRGRGTAWPMYRISTVVKRKAGVGSGQIPRPTVAVPAHPINQLKPICRKAPMLTNKKTRCTYLGIRDIINL